MTATDHNHSWLLLGFAGTVQIDGDMPGHSLQKQDNKARQEGTVIPTLCTHWDVPTTTITGDSHSAQQQRSP